MMRRFGSGWRMIPKSGNRFSDKIMRKQKVGAQRGCALRWMGQRDDAEKRYRIGGRPWHAYAAV
jgi:hypothetical protein